MSARQRTGAHAAFAMSQDENWAEISDAQKRKRVQNRLAQRSYRHKVRERLQELDQLKTAEHGSGASTSGSSSRSSSRRSSSQTLECNTATHMRSASTAPMNARISVSRTSSASSHSSESALFPILDFSDPLPDVSGSPVTWSLSPEKATQEASGIDDFLASLYTTESNESVNLPMAAQPVSSSESWTATSWTKATDFGFDLLGSVSQPAAITNDAELKFTELMLKIREVGFVDMESMILEYYTTRFRRDSLPYWLQRRSRQHNLSKMLEQLQLNSSSWPAEESAAFQESIRCLAQQIMASEHSGGDTLLSFPSAIGNDFL